VAGPGRGSSGWGCTLSALSPEDLRITVEGEVLDVLSGHGGEVLAAGPQMYRLVQELTDLVIKWAGPPGG
jgi:hypothetical protein